MENLDSSIVEYSNIAVFEQFSFLDSEKSRCLSSQETDVLKMYPSGRQIRLDGIVRRLNKDNVSQSVAFSLDASEIGRVPHEILILPSVRKP